MRSTFDGRAVLLKRFNIETEAPFILREVSAMRKQEAPAWQLLHATVFVFCALLFMTCSKKTKAVPRFKHPNLAEVSCGFFGANATFYLELPFYGDSLAERPSEFICQWGKKIVATSAAGLERLHACGIIHGNIGPGCFAVTGDGSARLVLDFSKVILRPDCCKAPELGSKLGIASEAMEADIFALGAVWLVLSDRHKALDKRAIEMAKRMTCAEADCRPTAEMICKQSKPGAPPSYWYDLLLTDVPQSHPVEVPSCVEEALRDYCLVCKFPCYGAEGPHHFNVKGMWRLEHPELWRAYQDCRKQMRQDHQDTRHTPPSSQVANVSNLASDDLNEAWLWHGSDALKVESIQREGFDARRASMQGKFGAGCYFTNQVCKARQYARAPGCSIFQKRCKQFHCGCKPSSRFLLLCRVTLGSVYRLGPNSDMRGVTRPPPVQGARQLRHDSCVVEPFPGTSGQGQVHREVVVFNGQQIYPEFLIEISIEPSR